MFKKNTLIKLIFIGISFCYSSLASSSIVITGTRVIFHEAKGNAVVQLNNRGTTPALVQAWLDTGNARSQPGDEKLPFYISPPISRVEPNQGQALKVLNVDPSLPQDRESLFWLNILELPPKPKNKVEMANYMQIAIRSRIKFLFRPKAITAIPEQYIEQLTWSVKGNKLEVTNPSPFYYTFIAFNYGTKDKPLTQKESAVVEPFASYQFKLPKGFKTQSGSEFKATWLNDNGYKIVQEFKI